MPELATGIVLTVVATVIYNVTIVVQKSEAQKAPTEGVRILVTLAKRPLWLLAAFGQLAAAGITVIALTYAPITVVQPIVAGGVILVAVFARLILGERTGKREWTGIALVACGLALLMLTLDEQAEVERFSYTTLIITLTVLSALVFGLLAYERRLRKTNEGASGVVFGMGAGLARGTSDSGKPLMSAFIAGGLASGTAAGWVPPAFIGVLGLALLAGFGFVGFVAQQNALKLHKATHVVPPLLVTNLIVPIAVAVIVYGQNLPSGAGYLAARATSLAFLVGGIIVLATSQSVAAAYTEEASNQEPIEERVA